MGTGARATDPELDGALARAIRQLIAEAVSAGGESKPGEAATGQSAA